MAKIRHRLYSGFLSDRFFTLGYPALALIASLTATGCETVTDTGPEKEVTQITLHGQTKYPPRDKPATYTTTSQEEADKDHKKLINQGYVPIGKVYAVQFNNDWVWKVLPKLAAEKGADTMLLINTMHRADRVVKRTCLGCGQYDPYRGAHGSTTSSGFSYYHYYIINGTLWRKSP